MWETSWLAGNRFSVVRIFTLTPSFRSLRSEPFCIWVLTQGISCMRGLACQGLVGGQMEVITFACAGVYVHEHIFMHVNEREGWGTGFQQIQNEMKRMATGVINSHSLFQFLEVRGQSFSLPQGFLTSWLNNTEVQKNFSCGWRIHCNMK